MNCEDADATACACDRAPVVVAGASRTNSPAAMIEAVRVRAASRCSGPAVPELPGYVAARPAVSAADKTTFRIVSPSGLQGDQSLSNVTGAGKVRKIRNGGHPAPPAPGPAFCAIWPSYW